MKSLIIRIWKDQRLLELKYFGNKEVINNWKDYNEGWKAWLFCCVDYVNQGRWTVFSFFLILKMGFEKMGPLYSGGPVLLTSLHRALAGPGHAFESTPINQILCVVHVILSLDVNIISQS